MDIIFGEPDRPTRVISGRVISGRSYAHHDDAWRKAFSAYEHDLPDIGPSVLIDLFESEYPHELGAALTMIVPLEVIKDIWEAINGDSSR